MNYCIKMYMVLYTGEKQYLSDQVSVGKTLTAFHAHTVRGGSPQYSGQPSSARSCQPYYPSMSLNGPLTGTDSYPSVIYSSTSVWSCCETTERAINVLHVDGLKDVLKQLGTQRMIVLIHRGVPLSVQKQGVRGHWKGRQEERSTVVWSGGEWQVEQAKTSASVTG